MQLAPCGFVNLADLHRVEIRANHAARRAGLLHLGDQPNRPARGQGVKKFRTGGAAAACSRRQRLGRARFAAAISSRFVATILSSTVLIKRVRSQSC